MELFFHHLIDPFLTTRAELCHVSMKELKKEAMLQRINRNYKGEVTLEQVMEKLPKFGKAKMPFYIFCGVYLAAEITRVTLMALIVSGSLTSIDFVTVQITRRAVALFLYTCEGIVFLIYGNRIWRIMPVSLRPRMKRVSSK